MKLGERVWFRTVIDTLHDLSGGALIGGVYVLWVVRNGAKAALPPDAFAAMIHTWSWLLVFLLVAITIQVGTGLVRLTHWSAHVDPQAVASKRRMAWAKHAVFATLFLGATVSVFLILQP